MRFCHRYLIRNCRPEVILASGEASKYDKVAFACHADQALDLLDELSRRDRSEKTMRKAKISNA